MFCRAACAQRNAPYVGYSEAFWGFSPHRGRILPVGVKFGAEESTEVKAASVQETALNHAFSRQCNT